MQNKEWIFAKNIKELSQATLYVFNLNHINHRGNGNDGKSGCVNGIRAGPYFLLMGKTISQQKPVTNKATPITNKPVSIWYMPLILLPGLPSSNCFCSGALLFLYIIAYEITKITCTMAGMVLNNPSGSKGIASPL